MIDSYSVLTVAHGAPAARIWSARGSYKVRLTNEVWRDATRARDIPVRIYTPKNAPAPMPVVVFSHGLGGNIKAGEEWDQHWASWGIVCVTVQHHGSDTDAIRDGAGTSEDRLDAAMGAAQLIARSQDVKIAASETARRAALGDAVFHGVDPAAIGLAGHSFGAQTTLAAAGQSFPDFGPKLAVPAFRAFIAFSPSAHDTNDLDGQYRSITAPFLSLTGSQDEIALTPEITPENRTLPFSHMYPGNKYLAWLDTASHMSFGGQPTERVRMPRIAEALGEGSVLPNDVHISKVVRAVTTAFWLAYLEPSTQIGRDARIWLGGSGPRALLAPGDRWRSR